MPERSFLSRVRHILPDLPPAERKLGELVRDFPGELASFSASELADLAAVSNATVSRFVRRLGYASYDEARRHARLEKASGSRLFLDAAREGGAQDPLSYAQTDMRNVMNTIEPIPQEVINTLARTMLEARKVWVVGFRVGAPLAHYVQWQLLQVLENSVALPGHGQTMGEHIAGVQPEDVVILFGLRRRVAFLEDLVAGLAATGTKIALITDESMGPRTDVTWHFRCSTESSGPLFSHVGVMALLNLIANRTIALAGDAGRKRLAKIEAANDLLGEL